MKSAASLSARTALGLAVAALLTACSPSPSAEPAESFRRGEEAWRAARAAEVKGPESWLTIVGLFWLSEGGNAFGADAANPICLPSDASPAKAGVLVMDKGAFRLKAAPGVSLAVNGAPAAADAVLKDEGRGKPDVVGLGRLTFWIIKRDDRYAIRLRDPEAAPRKAFTRIEYFAPDPAYRVTGDLKLLPEPRTIRVEAKIVGSAEMTAVGTVAFRFGGRDYEVEAWKGEIEGTVHFVLGDATNGGETYGGGRFLDASLLDGGKVDLNFNRLYNPPCAFSAFATCPLPPASNRLPFRIEAGEKAYEAAGH